MAAQFNRTYLTAREATTYRKDMFNQDTRQEDINFIVCDRNNDVRIRISGEMQGETGG